MNILNVNPHNDSQLMHVSTNCNNASCNARRPTTGYTKEKGPSILKTIIYDELCFPYSHAGYIATTYKRKMVDLLNFTILTQSVPSDLYDFKPQLLLFICINIVLNESHLHEMIPNITAKKVFVLSSSGPKTVRKVSKPARNPRTTPNE